jgi:drug/metabolite transporter (DMT)-like permease
VAAPAVSPARPLATISVLLRSPRWVAGAALGYGGLALQTAALAVIPVSTVQAIIAAGVVVVALGSGRVARRAPTGREALAAAATVAALGLLALAAPPSNSGGHAAPVALAGWALVAAGGAAALLLTRRGARDAGRLGLASGALYGTATVALAALLAAPSAPLAAEAVAVGGLSAVGGFFAFQRGLQVGPPVAVVTLMLCATNVVAISGGLIAMHDPLAGPGVPRALQLAALALAVGGAALVAGGLAGPAPAADRSPKLAEGTIRSS